MRKKIIELDKYIGCDEDGVMVTKKMYRCPYCNEYLRHHSLYCPHCGKKIKK